MKILKSIPKLKIIKSLHLHRSKGQDWIDAVYWLISTFFTGLMPVWLPVLLLLLFSRHPLLTSFTGNGEFALISASLLSASAYVITKDSRWNFLRDWFGDVKNIEKMKHTFPAQRFFIYATNILTLLATVIYTGALFSKLEGVNLTLDSHLVSSLSLILFGITILITFFITVIDNAFSNRPDIPGLRNEALEKLESRFNAVKED